MEWNEETKQRELKIKMDHLRKYFDFSDEELDEISLYYQGKEDLESKGVKRLFEISDQLCHEFNTLSTDPKNKSKESGRKGAILKRLFPNCPGISYIRRGLQLVIGNVRIESSVFLNVNATFGYNTDVYIGHNAQFGPNVRIVEKGNERKATFIGAGVWFGGGVTYIPGVSIGENSVVGAGGYVNEDIPSNVLALGRPAKVKREIAKGEMFSVPGESVLSDEEIEFARTRMKAKPCGAPSGLYTKVLRGKAFSTASLPLSFLYLRSQALCRQLDNPELSEKEREEIIDELFPIHGKNVKIGKNFFMDLIGIVALGDNVTIGDNVSLGGLVRLGNNVTIGDNCVLFASNHPLDVAERGFGFHKGIGLSVPIVYTTIEIKEGAKIGKDSIIAPKSKIEQDIPDGSLVLANGKIVALPEE